MAVCPNEYCLCPLSSASFSATVFPFSRSTAGVLPRNRRCMSPDEVGVVGSRGLKDDEINRLRGNGDDPKAALSGGEVCPMVDASREVAARKPFTSVTALDGVRRRIESSSSSCMARRVRKREVLRPSWGIVSGSSVTALRFPSMSDDLLPVVSSGSSVPARKLRRNMDDFRPALVDSIGVNVNGDAAYRELDRFDVASIVILLCSKLVGARGLVVGSNFDGVGSVKTTARFGFEGIVGLELGLLRTSASRNSASRVGCGNCGCLVGTVAVSSASAMHNSVKLLQILSAFRRSCRSVRLMPTPPPTVLAPLEIGPGCPGAPIMFERARASVAADSMALKTSGLTRFLVLESADMRIGCDSRCDDVELIASTGAAPAPDPRFGDADIVVALVVAVGGRSSDARDMAAPEVGGIFPVSSNRWIRDLRSSNSSHTVDGAAVDAEDSVPSTPWLASTLAFC